MESIIRGLRRIQNMMCTALRVVSALWSLVLLFAGVPQSCLAQAQNPQYTLTNLGFVYGSSLSDKGQVAGFLLVNNGYHPFLWDATNGVQDLGLPAGSTSAYATGVNSLGHVAGTSTGPLFLIYSIGTQNLAF